MKYALSQLEQVVPDELLEKAEALVARHAVAPVKEVEKNLWTSQVQTEAEAALEVEVQMRGKKVIAYSCDCEQYSNKELCVHLTAFSLQLRQWQAKKAEERQQHSPPPLGPKRLTTNAVLQRVSLAELQAFVRNYAKSNRQFALALKARFASAVSEMDREEKYQQVLLTAIKSVQRQGRRIPSSRLKQLVTVLEELQEQCHETIDRQDFQESFAILRAIFKQVPKAMRIVEGDKMPLLQVIKENIRLLDQLLQAAPAPSLENEIWNFLLAAIQDRYLGLYNIDRQLLALAMAKGSKSHRAQELLDLIDTLLPAEGDIQHYEEVELLIAKLDLLDILGQEERRDEVINANLQQVVILSKAIELAEQQENTERVRQLAQMGLQLELEPATRKELEDRLLQIALEEKDRTAIRQLAQRLLLSSYEQSYWEILKKWSERIWEKTKAKVIAALERQSFTVAKRDIMAHIYASEQDRDGLLQFLQQTRSLDLLLQYDQQLRADQLALVQDLYRELLTEYLNQHLGRQASVKVKRVLSHLRDTGAQDFVEQLLLGFRAEYQTRHSLMEELSEF